MRKLSLIIFFLLCVLIVSCAKETETNIKTEPIEKTQKQEVVYVTVDDSYIYHQQDNGLMKKLIDKFNEKNEFIKVKCDTKDPDIIPITYGSYNYLPTEIKNRSAADITEFTTKDLEWDNVEKGLKNSVTYNDRVYGIPLGQYFKGYIANFDLIDKVINSSATEMLKIGEFELEEFLDVIYKAKEYTKREVVGVDYSYDMINWLPSALDETNKLKYYMWNGEEMDYTNPYSLEAIKIISMCANKESKLTFESYIDFLSDENPAEKVFGSTDVENVFQNQNICMMLTHILKDRDNNGFNYGFVGLPGNKVISVPKYLYISNNCEHKEEAFKVAKYLSYGSEGIIDQTEILKNNPELVTGFLPVNTDMNVVGDWLDLITVPGVKEMYQSVSSGKVISLVEGDYYIPYYNEVRNSYDTKIKIDGVRGGLELKIGDFIYELCQGSIDPDLYLLYMTGSLKDELNRRVIDFYLSIE